MVAEVNDESVDSFLDVDRDSDVFVRRGFGGDERRKRGARKRHGGGLDRDLESVRRVWVSHRVTARDPSGQR
jgi:hypothetical protein